MSEQTVSEAAELIKNECDNIKKVLLEKNEKYGNSALNPIRIFSKADNIEQIKVRLDDKIMRINSGKAHIEDEDVTLDIMGYLVLLRIAQKMQK